MARPSTGTLPWLVAKYPVNSMAAASARQQMTTIVALEGHAAELRGALRAAHRLLAERLQVAHEVGQEVGADDAGADVGLVDGAGLAGELHLRRHLVHHRAEGLVRGGGGAGGDVVRVVREAEALVLLRLADARLDEAHDLGDLLGVRVPRRRLIERQRVARQGVDVVRLLVNLVGVEARRQDEGEVHQAAALVGDVGAREVDEAVHEQEHGILVAVALPPATASAARA